MFIIITPLVKIKIETVYVIFVLIVLDIAKIID